MICVYKIVLLCILDTLFFPCIACEVFSSVAKMNSMVHKLQHDLTVSNHLKPVMQKLHNYEKDIKDLVLQLEELSSGIKKPDFDPRHPLNAYKFIRNHSMVYNETAELILGVIDRIENVNIEKTLKMVLARLPTLDDLEGLMDGIYRLQMTYNLDPADIAQGKVSGLTAPRMSALECVEMADLCVRKKSLQTARQWMQQAIRFVTEMNDRSIPTKEVHQKMMAFAFVAGDMDTAEHYCKEVIRLTQRSKRRRIRKILRHIRYEIENDLQQGEGWTIPEKTRKKTKYDALCQGRLEEFEDPERKAALSTLKCRYKKIRNPFYKYQRIKLEERSRDPYVALYHDVFREPELQRLRRLALPKLKRSSVVDRETGGRKSSKSRVSQGMSLTGDLVKKATPIVRRIEALTGLRSGKQYYESLQVTNYGFGGMYNEHFDAFPPNYFKQKGLLRNQRMATFMIYLSDVAAGGATVFPSIPDVVFPKAGNALFWYNTYRNGTDDQRMGHGGCPVIVGDKWLANQWIRSWGHEFTRPCSLNRTE